MSARVEMATARPVEPATVAGNLRNMLAAFRDGHDRGLRFEAEDVEFVIGWFDELIDGIEELVARSPASHDRKSRRIAGALAALRELFVRSPFGVGLGAEAVRKVEDLLGELAGEAAWIESGR